MRVLFVDDEPKVLDGLRRSMFQLGADWEALYAGGGVEALALLEKGPADVLVTDMRMPGMDGATLIEVVREKYPGMARIVLTGQTDEGSAFRALKHAHQFLSKPCGPGALRQVIEDSTRLMNVLSSDVVRGLIGHVDSLPAASTAYSKLSALVEDPNANIEQATAVIAADPALATKAMQVANSMYFRRGAEVTGVRNAVARLGMRLLRGLALSVQAFESAALLGPDDARIVARMQQQSLDVASVAQRLVQPGQADLAFTSALLCDVGALALRVRAPKLAHQIDAAVALGAPEELAERDLAGATHSEIGAYLVSMWGLPLQIAQAVAQHHAPRASDPAYGVADAVYIATRIVRSEPLDLEYVRACGVSSEVQAALVRRTNGAGAM